jgi:hypothetical protein
VTVIAWDGQTLAADRQMEAFGGRSTTTKIFRYGNVLCGGSGDASCSFRVLEWIRSGRAPADFPKFEPNDDVEVIVIEPGPRILIYERHNTPIHVEDQHYAIGCGRHHARAAMYCGRDARGAVEVANALHTGCGGGCDSLTFDPAPLPSVNGARLARTVCPPL